MELIRNPVSLCKEMSIRVIKLTQWKTVFRPILTVHIIRSWTIEELFGLDEEDNLTPFQEV